MNDKRRRGLGGPDRNRLYKNSNDRVIAGVCSGVADYFGFDVVVTRVLVAVGGLFFWPFVVIVYIVLALVLDSKPGSAPNKAAPEEERERDAVSRRVRAEPHATLRSVRYRFRELDQRLQRIEKYVTSDRFELDREFEGLKDQ